MIRIRPKRSVASRVQLKPISLRQSFEHEVSIVRRTEGLIDWSKSCRRPVRFVASTCNRDVSYWSNDKIQVGHRHLCLNRVAERIVWNYSNSWQRMSDFPRPHARVVAMRRHRASARQGDAGICKVKAQSVGSGDPIPLIDR